MDETKNNETAPDRNLRSLEAKAKASTKPDLAESAQRAIRSLQKQRHLSQEELHRMVTI